MILYRAFIAPLGLMLALFLALFSQKIRSVIRLRFSPIDWPNWVGQTDTLWIHCSSGEFEYARPVIREYKALKPQARVFVTYFSSSYKRAVEKCADVDGSAPLPFDFPGPLIGFIRKLRPSHLAIARTDIWPELCYQAQRAGIPITVFSRTQRDPTQMSWLSRYFTGWLYNNVSQILTVSDADTMALKALKIERVLTVGDSRFDQVTYRLKNPKPIQSQFFSSSSPPILVAGSTWPEDERQLLSACQSLLKRQQLRLLLVPHEVDLSHLERIEALCQRFYLSTQRYSNAKHWESEILIVDQVGILAELYQVGQLAFVGGSFRRTVHSIMEPLAAGLPVFVGPYYQNNREAIEFLKIPIGKTSTIVQSSKDAADLEMQISARLNQSEVGPMAKIVSEVERRQGASRKIAERLLDKLMNV